MTQDEFSMIYMLCSVGVGEVYSFQPYMIDGLNKYDFVETS